MAILMGLDQHRAQITTEWVDTSTGEVSRARVALKGSKKHAKNDRADARHLRELLMAGRLPESWIAPAHILDLRARVRLRHTLSEQRGEWQQRIQSVLYHHGCPQRGDLINRAGLTWLAAQPLPACAREQVTAGLAMIDALERQLAPLDKELRSYARRQPGCKALMRHYGIGALTAVTILAELGDPGRFSSSREAVRFAGLDITVHASDQAARARASVAPRTAGAALGAVRSRPMRPTTKFTRPHLLPGGSEATRRQPCLPISGAETAQAQLPHTARTRRGGPATRMTSPVRAKPYVTPMHRGQLPPSSCRQPHLDGHHRPSGRNASPSGITPSTIMSPTRNHPGSRTEIRLGARAHHIPRPDHDRAPPTHPAVQPPKPESHLTSDGYTDKEPSSGSAARGDRNRRNAIAPHRQPGRPLSLFRRPASRDCNGDQTQPGPGRLLARRRLAPRPREAAVGRQSASWRGTVTAIEAIVR